MKNMLRMTACLAAGLLAFVALSATTAKSVDELEGLRPDTAGVETNRFWDTRGHATFTVQTAGGASTNGIDTAVLTVATSAAGKMGVANGTAILVK